MCVCVLVWRVCETVWCMSVSVYISVCVCACRLVSIYMSVCMDVSVSLCVTIW
jgi:hypothetical protein